MFTEPDEYNEKNRGDRCENCNFVTNMTYDNVNGD